MASIFCKYLDGTTLICYNTDSFSDIKVNGVSIGLTREYNVNSTDEVEFVMSDTILKENSFIYCNSLTSAVIGNTITQIENQVFLYCDNLTNVTIGESVTNIGDYAFASCPKLVNIISLATVAPTITSVTFSGVGLDGTLTYPEGSDYSRWLSKSSKYLGYYGWNVQAPVAGERIIVCRYNADETIPICYRTDSFSDIRVNGKSIGLTKTYGGKYSNIFEFVLKGDTLESYAFEDCDKLVSVDMGASITTIGNSVFKGCTGLTSCTIGNSVETIGSMVFDDCVGLTDITIPDSVITMNGRIFRGCTGLTNCTIGNSVETIGSMVFDDCTNLETVVIGESVKVVGEYLFHNCPNLTNVTILAPVEPTIEKDSFSIYPYLVSKIKKHGTLTYPDGADYSTWMSTNNGAFGYYLWNDYTQYTYTLTCSGHAEKQSVKQGSSSVFLDIKINNVSVGLDYDAGAPVGSIVEYILPIGQDFPLFGTTKDSGFPDSNWANCYSKVVIGEGCERVPNQSFYKYRSLTNIVFPSTLKYIGEYAFRMTSLTSVTIPKSVEHIAKDAFYSLRTLRSVKIGDINGDGDGADCVIDEYAFADCFENTKYDVYDMQYVGLKEIIIGDNVVSIEAHAFENCVTLKTLKIGNGPTIIKENAFKNTYYTKNYDDPKVLVGLESITIGDGVKIFENNAFNYCLKVKSITISSPVAPTIASETFHVDYDGTLYYPKGSDYSQWLSTDRNYLGFWGWNGVEVESPDTPVDPDDPDTPVDPDDPDTPVDPDDPDTPVDPDNPDEPDTPEITPDPTIVVSKNNITLNNVGDTSIIQVTYIDVDEIIPLEAPDGFEIVEIERVEVGSGMQVKYQIKRISPKRQNAQINFKGSTSDGKTATSSKVTLSGDPVPATVKVAMIWPSDAPTDPNSVFYIGRDGNDSDIKINVDNPNAPYQMTYQINGNNDAISCIGSEVSEGDNYVYYKYEFKTIENNTNKPFTGTIDFHYTDELTDKTVSVTYYVPYANEGRISADSTRYEYDKDGNSTFTLNGGDFSISYFNMETINTPVSEVDWITLGEGVLDTGVYVDERVKYNYSIDVSPNAGPERTGYVIFSGKGIDGKDYTFEIAVKQEGTNTEKPIDEGFIELLQLSVVLPGNGGSETFQVKYYDARTIYQPELQYSWATIREVSRTEPTPDVAWNGEECDSVIVTYEVTAQATDGGREMKVKFFSDINYYDGGVVHMEKDKFVIYQLAEGSTELQGSVKLIRGNGEYTYYGSAIGWDPEVGYKDVTPGTPVISQNWCRIKNVKDKTSKDYDYYKTYELEVDTNNSTLSRTCQITFVGNCEDGTQIKAIFIVTQKGQDEIINEGEYSNYKGYFMDFEGAVHSISFITNPKYDTYGDIRLSGDEPVIVSYTDSDTLYEPLRTSTCTIRVVSSHYLMNLYSGKAQGTQVILKNEDRGTIEWCGFLQPNLYNQGYSSEIEEIEFVASDCLSTLQYMKYEYYFNGNGMPMIVSFKNIVDSIVNKCRLINSYAFTQKMYSNSEATKIIDFKDFYISENNFYSEEGEPWTYMEVLEEVCKYFGYVCFQWGDRVYFIDYDNYTSTKSMTGYVYEKDDDWRSRTMKTLSNYNRITEDSYRGTGADMSLDDIYNKITVNCNYYNVEHILPDLFEDDKLTERDGITITTLVNRGQEIGSKTSYITYDHDNIISHFYKPLSSISNHQIKVTPTEDEFKSNKFFKSFVGANIVDMYHLDYGDVSGRSYESKEWERYLMISQLNRPWCGYEGTWHWEDYNFPIMEFTQLPQIFIDNNEEVYSSNTSTGGRVPSRRASGIGTSSSTSRNDRNTVTATKSEHYLVINAEAAFSPNFDVPFIDENADPKGFGKKSNPYYEGFYFDKIRTNDDAVNKDERQKVTPALTFYLEIPQAGWWNGREWVDYETWFEVPLENLDYLDDLWYSTKNVENKVNTNLFLGTTGYKIALPKAIESTAFMQFKIGMPKRFAHIADIDGGDYTGTAGNAYCFIKDLEINIVSRNSALMKDEDIVFENVIDDFNVVDGPEISLKITSDNNITYSFSTVSTSVGDADEQKVTTNFRFYDLNGELILPEEAIIEKYVNQYSTPSLRETVTVDMSFTPTQLITDTYWNKDFVVVGGKIDYQMCTQTLTLLEKK